MKKKPLVVIDIPNGKALAQIAEHFGYPTETIEQFLNLEPTAHFPAYLEERDPKNDSFWGSNMAWIPEYRYNHVEYKVYIKEARLKPKQLTKREIHKWVKAQITDLKSTFTQHFPEESFSKYVRKVI